MKSSKRKRAFFVSAMALVSLSLIVGFQNCAKTGITAAATSDPVYYIQNNADTVTMGPVQVSPRPVDPANPANSYQLISGLVLQDFVTGGGQAACDADVKNSFGYSPKACTLGGGCGQSCGLPGSNCPSANPNSWGACFYATPTMKGIVGQVDSPFSAFSFEAGVVYSYISCQGTVPRVDYNSMSQNVDSHCKSGRSAAHCNSVGTSSDNFIQCEAPMTM